MTKALFATAAAFLTAAPAFAQQSPEPAGPPIVLPFPDRQAAQPQPAPLPAVIVPTNWAGVFAALRKGDWAGARAGIATLPADPLTPVAKAELYTARNSPVVSLAELQALLSEAPELPQAEQLARMALARGAITPPSFVPKQPVVSLGSPPGRYRARPVAGEPLADALRAKLDSFVEVNDAIGAELLVTPEAPMLSPNARAEAWQRVAWIYYIIAQDAHARRVADAGRIGATGDWAAASAWISGLASWRLGDCNAASQSFREVIGSASQRELRAGAYYWAARAEQACRRPQAVVPLLKAAAASSESFYGLLARESLGTHTRIPRATPISTTAVDPLPNVRRARALAAIGEHSLAEQMLRHQARIGLAGEHRALIEVAKQLQLTGTQYWLATNGPPGAQVEAADRYPLPDWTPVRGWRVEPSLAFAHAIQESRFQSGAVSPIGAVGLLQVRPGTASDMARAAGLPFAQYQLVNPTYNLEFGQSFIERLRGSGATQGQLPKVIAAYNAGPVPVSRWAGIHGGGGDPLLWIESIPYWETRFYVPAVLRNLWVYEGLARKSSPSLSALAQNRWPSFPAAR